ncbi:MAG: tRNA threonylcarbamoyladenosine dehydratase [Paludibacteraceae bacterium]|nr:tRNA threonylcarbamoyladenosine dehydratase [Paludibacteraceae bacterium]
MEQFERTIQLLGNESFNRLQQTRIILFGVGGVGGWCAETLVRTGVQHLTLVDFDVVSPSNINRQVVATSENIGQPKVVEMKKRLLAICPEADIVAVQQRYTAETASQFDLTQYDYVIDAIDSVEDKVLLIYNATAVTRLVASMGAGRKTDSEQIHVAEFWKVEGCPLARALRTKMKKTDMLPHHKFECVYSPELSAESGTIAPIVGIFGMKIADIVINQIIKQSTV